MHSRLPPVTQALLITNVALFLLQSLLGPATFEPFALWPPTGLFDQASPPTMALSPGGRLAQSCCRGG